MQEKLLSQGMFHLHFIFLTIDDFQSVNFFFYSHGYTLYLWVVRAGGCPMKPVVNLWNVAQSNVHVRDIQYFKIALHLHLNG